MLKRRLIIIANTGGEANYCESVIYDRANYIEFFKSPEGGYWSPNEMILPEVNTCTFDSIRWCIDEAEKDGPVFYWVVVFAGHGWENSEDETMLELYPNSPAEEDLPIGWLQERFSKSRCLLIADCCRNPLQPLNERVQDSGPTIRFFSGGGRIGYPLECKSLYNSQILRLRAGQFVVGYAASFNQGAKNLPDDTGGMYSSELLKTAKSYIEAYRGNAEEDKIASMSYIHSIAKKNVETKTNGQQIPQIYYERGFQPPFCVIPKDF